MEARGEAGCLLLGERLPSGLVMLDPGGLRCAEAELVDLVSAYRVRPGDLLGDLRLEIRKPGEQSLFRIFQRVLRW